MEVVFLGTGTSQGVPMIACGCAVCASTDPRNQRTRSSIHVVTYLTHLTHSVDHEAWSGKLPNGVALAYDGLRLAL